MRKTKKLLSILSVGAFGVGFAYPAIWLVLRIVPRGEAGPTTLGLIMLAAAISLGFGAGGVIWAMIATRMKLLTWDEVEIILRGSERRDR